MRVRVRWVCEGRVRRGVRRGRWGCGRRVCVRRGRKRVRVCVKEAEAV